MPEPQAPADQGTTPDQGLMMGPSLGAVPCQPGGAPKAPAKVKVPAPAKDPFAGSLTGRAAWDLVMTKAPTIDPTNFIFITFNPDASQKVVECADIRFVQVVQVLVDGNAIKPSAWSQDWQYQDQYTTGNGWCVDFLKGQTEPYYTRGIAHGVLGSGWKKPPLSLMQSHSAGMADEPSAGMGGATANMRFSQYAVHTVVYKFETFACCASGKDCGGFYEGITWTYTKTWQDADAGRVGTSLLVTTNIAQPSKDFLDAYNLFNSTMGFKPCAP